MRFMQPFELLREGLRWLLATAVTILITAVLVLLHADSTTSGILYLVLVVWSATLAGRAVSIYLAVLASLFFDYYFLPPVHSLGLSGFREWLAMFAFVASCVIVGRVAERARRETRQAEQRREDVERLYALSQEMMLHEDAAGLMREMPRLVEHNFVLDAVLLYVRDEDQLYSSVPSVPVPGNPVLFTPEPMREALRVVSATLEPNSELPQ